MSCNHFSMQRPADSSALWSHMNGWLFSHKQVLYVDVRVSKFRIKDVFRSKCLRMNRNDIQTLGIPLLLKFILYMFAAISISIDQNLKNPLGRFYLLLEQHRTVRIAHISESCEVEVTCYPGRVHPLLFRDRHWNNSHDGLRHRKFSLYHGP
ncbi:hypothetical protein F4604DRAFT_1773118 [Suillus subluteus]|nr:hypothetical protein F4604DRAFT_1773118 [Suillus subluteus]